LFRDDALTRELDAGSREGTASQEQYGASIPIESEPIMLRTAYRVEKWMTCRSNDFTIDEIIASCSGDTRGALQALLMVNEQLEAELTRLYAAVTNSGMLERGGGALH
jgi:hypothetical protein